MLHKESPARPKWSILVKIAIGFGAAIILACVICIIWISVALKNFDPFTTVSYQPVQTNIPEIKIIEGNAEIKVPPSAREIYSYQGGFQEIFIMVRLTIDAKDLPQFLAGTRCTEPLYNVSPSEQPSHSFGQSWWEPNLAGQLERCQGGRSSISARYRQEILVDITNPEYYIIYVSTTTD